MSKTENVPKQRSDPWWRGSGWYDSPVLGPEAFRSSSGRFREDRGFRLVEVLDE